MNGARLASRMMQAGIDWKLSWGAFKGLDIVNVDERGAEATVLVQMHFSRRSGDLTLKMVKEGSDWKVRPPGSS